MIFTIPANSYRLFFQSKNNFMDQQTSISTLIFDFGGVIINLDLPLCISRLQAIGADNTVQYLTNFGQSGFFLGWERGDVDLEEFRANVRSISTGNPTDEEIDEAWMAFLQDIPAEKINLLKQLRPHYRILMLSNTNPLHIERSAPRAFAEHGTSMEELFDRCYLSYQIGMTKPDPAIFNYLLEQEGVTANECLFLDDGVKNIDTASAMGFQTRLIDPAESLDFLLNLKKQPK
jgi:HAD superfamily hydrolase (TIGR01509 family)